MLLFSLSLSLQSLTKSSPTFLQILSFSLITYKNCLSYQKRTNLLVIVILSLMLSSSSSVSTFAFDMSSIETINRKEKYHLTKSITCLNETNCNRNANDADEYLKKEKRFRYRFIQSSTDLTTNDLSFSHNPHRNHQASRVESALITSDYCHLLSHSIIHASRPIIDMNMNRTIDGRNRNGAGDENLSSYIDNKPVQTSIQTDQPHYLTLEQIPIQNQRKIQLTSKQLILISISVFVFVTLLSTITIFVLV